MTKTPIQFLYKTPFIFLFSILIFFTSWFIAYKTGINKLAIQSEDTVPALFLPIMILKDQTLYLDNYYQMMLEKYPQPDDKKQERGLTPFYLKKVGTHYLSAFPIITPLIALPVYIPFVLLDLPVTWDNLAILGHLSGALIVSLAGLFLFKLCKNHLDLTDNQSLLITTIYLFGTINFALLSQAMWQHGTVGLLSILALYFLFEKRWLLFGAFLGLAILSRPTAVLITPFLGLLMISQIYKNISMKEFFLNLTKLLLPAIKTLLGLAIPVMFFIWYTEAFYLGIENNGYFSQAGNSWLSKFPAGFLGMWFSPSKGILVYSPIIFFGLVGIWNLFKQERYKKEENLKYIIFACIVLIHTLVLSLWKHWYGGWGFGYRMASDVIPFMVLCIVPFIKSDLFEKRFWFKLFMGFLVLSVLIQLFGIFFFDGIWHAAYDRGFRDQSWLWSIWDSEFVFNVRRILVKFGLLDRACPQCLG